jgi:hypothetical protein
MNWKQIKKEINWDKVDSAIIHANEDSISSDRFKLAKEMVTDAAEYFLPGDLKWFTIEAIEHEFKHEYQPDLIDRGFIDLILTVKDTAPKPYKDFAGQKILVDWKSTSGELGTTWRDYYIESFQWKRYSNVIGNVLFEYRGISSKKLWSDNKFVCQCAPLILQVPKNNAENVTAELYAMKIQKKALLPLTIYPRNMPNACFKYGETCGRYDDCANFTMPKELLVHPETTSYSTDELFKLCPEKYRRAKLDNVREDDFESASGLGTLVHRGLAEIYTQFI